MTSGSKGGGRRGMKCYSGAWQHKARGERGGGASMGRVVETFPAQFSGFGQVFFALASFELIVARCALYPG